MNRNEFLNLDAPEVLTEIGEDFVFAKGQIFKEKPFDDEYIVVVEVGDQVNAMCDGLEENGKVQYNARFWHSTPSGKPIKLTWHGRTGSESYSHYDLLRKYYFFTGKVAPQAYLDILEPTDKDSDHLDRIQAGNMLIDVVTREPKDRRTAQEKEEMAKYEARMARNAMRQARVEVIPIPNIPKGSTGSFLTNDFSVSTAASDQPSYLVIHY